MRPAVLALMLVLSMGFSVWAFAGSSFETGVAVAGAFGAGLLGLAVFGRVRRRPLWQGIAALVGAQLVYLALWIVGGLLWAGPPRELPHFASPVQLSLEDLRGRWTSEDGRVYEVRGEWFCPVDEWSPAGQPSPLTCSSLAESQGHLTFFVDDQGVPARTYRRWDREVLAVEWSSLTFSRPIPER